jgi:hypothetical protein
LIFSDFWRSCKVANYVPVGYTPPLLAIEDTFSKDILGLFKKEWIPLAMRERG